MTEPKPLPHRPRLVDSARVRRHIHGGEEHLVLHDTARSEVIEIDPSQLMQLNACDGTRDIGGVVLQCVRQGVYQRFSTLTQFLGGLHERGLLTDGIAVKPTPAPTHPERPLQVLPGYHLECDQNGSCCSTYGSVQFTTADADRALAAVPEVLDGAPRERVFLPLTASGDARHSVTLVDGRCAFLGVDNACRIHQRRDSQAKPRGCRIFPTTFVDDGDSVRVSVGVECACVLSSVAGAGGAALVPEGAACEAHLLPGSRVVRLPAEIAVRHDHSEPREKLRGWADAVLAALPADGDVLAQYWALAMALGDHGLDVQAAGEALVAAAAPSAAAMALRLMALAAKTSSMRETTAGWRSPADRTRRLCAWLDDAAQRLMEQPLVTRLLTEPSAFAQDERFYLRATLFGHHLVSPPSSLKQALRDRATRVLLARAAAECVPTACQDDASATHPLTAVEAMMRGQGMADYAAGLP